MPGLTALRLKLTGSKSSSLRRLLLIRRVISAAVGGMPPCGPKPKAVCCDVSDLWLWLSLFVLNGNPAPEPKPPALPEPADGESMLISSLIPDEEPLGRKAGGGGVTLVPLMLLVSEKVSQKFFPLEFMKACFLKLLDKPVSIIISSSAMSSSPSRAVFKVGEVGVAVGAPGISRGGADPTVAPAPAVAVALAGVMRGDRSMSLSRTWRITSASRCTSASMGVLSSARAARIRAKPLVLGFVELVTLVIENSKVLTYEKIASSSDHPLNHTSLAFFA